MKEYPYTKLTLITLIAICILILLIISCIHLINIGYGFLLSLPLILIVVLWGIDGFENYWIRKQNCKNKQIDESK